MPPFRLNYERVEAIAERFGLDPTETLENVIVTRVLNHEQQIERAHVSHCSSNSAAATHCITVSSGQSFRQRLGFGNVFFFVKAGRIGVP